MRRPEKSRAKNKLDVLLHLHKAAFQATKARNRESLETLLDSMEETIDEVREAAGISEGNDE